MADIELVIKVPECFYEYCKAQTDPIEIQLAVANGIPLPKGHGRLIDADAMQKYQIDTFGQRLLVIDTAPTIIDAESEGKA